MSTPALNFDLQLDVPLVGLIWGLGDCHKKALAVRLRVELERFGAILLAGSVNLEVWPKAAHPRGETSLVRVSSSP